MTRGVERAQAAKGSGSAGAGLPLSGPGALVDSISDSALARYAGAHPFITTAVAAGVPAGLAMLYYLLQKPQAKKKSAMLSSSESGALR